MKYSLYNVLRLKGFFTICSRVFETLLTSLVSMILKKRYYYEHMSKFLQLLMSNNNMVNNKIKIMQNWNIENKCHWNILPIVEAAEVLRPTVREIYFQWKLCFSAFLRIFLTLDKCLFRAPIYNFIHTNLVKKNPTFFFLLIFGLFMTKNNPLSCPYFACLKSIICNVLFSGEVGSIDFLPADPVLFWPGPIPTTYTVKK